jgi:hypothetical protein
MDGSAVVLSRAETWAKVLLFPLSGVFSYLHPAWQAIPSAPCLIKSFTGHACPGCGMTRAIIALWHLDIGQAMSFHFLSPVVFALMATLSVTECRRLFRSKSLVV